MSTLYMALESIVLNVAQARSAALRLGQKTAQAFLIKALA